MKRNPNIELWRCICMFAVVLGHVLYVNGFYGITALQWHIPGFLIISGYFGIRFSFTKCFKLVATAYLCYWLTIPLREWGGFVPLAFPHGGWFLPFYCVLMLMSPLLNAAIDNAKSHRAICITILALVFFGWIPTFTSNPHVRMLAMPGMQGNGMLLMVATYMLGAMLRKYHVATRCNSCVWLLVFVVGIFACLGMGFIKPQACHYLSPISLVTASFGFLFFISASQISSSIGRFVNFISPSMFGIYLLHECCIRKYQYLSGGGGVMDVIVRTVALFCGCLMIDLTRRFMMYVIHIALRKVKNDKSN